jgi:hypothetical protein
MDTFKGLVLSRSSLISKVLRKSTLTGYTLTNLVLHGCTISASALTKFPIYSYSIKDS